MCFLRKYDCCGISFTKDVNIDMITVVVYLYSSYDIQALFCCLFG